MNYGRFIILYNTNQSLPWQLSCHWEVHFSLSGFTLFFCQVRPVKLNSKCSGKCHSDTADLSEIPPSFTDLIMASDGSGVPSGSPEDHRGEGTHPTDTPSPGAGVPADPNSAKDTLKATAGKSPCVVIYVLIHCNCSLFVKWVLIHVIHDIAIWNII